MNDVEVSKVFVPLRKFIRFRLTFTLSRRVDRRRLPDPSPTTTPQTLCHSELEHRRVDDTTYLPNFYLLSECPCTGSTSRLWMTRELDQ